MGRGKVKVKRSSSNTHRDDGSVEDEKLPVKRRGRPTKSHKQVEEEEEIENIDKIHDTKHEEDVSENRNKRKKASLQTEETSKTVNDENCGHELAKAVGFRHNGSRRKNKPRRAAEVGVSLCQVYSWVVLTG